MAETSGFFDAVQSSSGYYDRVYSADQFASFFAMFVNSGVSQDDSGMLKVNVSTTTGCVSVSDGYAFLNGYWYHNDGLIDLYISANTSSQVRTDKVCLRLSYADRTIKCRIIEGNSSVVRNSSYYELIIALIEVPTNWSGTVASTMIKDKRNDIDYCGLIASAGNSEAYTNLNNKINKVENEYKSADSNLANRISECLTSAKTYAKDYVDTKIATVSNTIQQIAANVSSLSESLSSLSNTVSRIMQDDFTKYSKDIFISDSSSATNALDGKIGLVYTNQKLTISSENLAILNTAKHVKLRFKIGDSVYTELFDLQTGVTSTVKIVSVPSSEKSIAPMTVYRIAIKVDSTGITINSAYVYYWSGKTTESAKSYKVTETEANGSSTVSPIYIYKAIIM